MDLLLLMVAYALAGGYCTQQQAVVSHAASEVGSIHYTATDIFFQIVVLGNVLACPIILTTQYLFRGRRTWLSEGEWLWLSPIVLGLTAMFWPGGDSALLLVGGGLFLCLCLCLLCILCRFGGFWGLATCHWTDTFGCLTCLSVALWVWYEATVLLDYSGY